MILPWLAIFMSWNTTQTGWRLRKYFGNSNFPKPGRCGFLTVLDLSSKLLNLKINLHEVCATLRDFIIINYYSLDNCQIFLGWSNSRTDILIKTISIHISPRWGLLGRLHRFLQTFRPAGASNISHWRIFLE